MGLQWGDKVWINGGYDREWYVYQGDTVKGYPILETFGKRPFTHQFVYYGNAELIPVKEGEIEDAD